MTRDSCSPTSELLFSCSCLSAIAIEPMYRPPSFSSIARRSLSPTDQLEDQPSPSPNRACFSATYLPACLLLLLRPASSLSCPVIVTERLPVIKALYDTHGGVRSAARARIEKGPIDAYHLVLMERAIELLPVRASVPWLACTRREALSTGGSAAGLYSFPKSRFNVCHSAERCLEARDECRVVIGRVVIAIVLAVFLSE